MTFIPYEFLSKLIDFDGSLQYHSILQVKKMVENVQHCCCAQKIGYNGTNNTAADSVEEKNGTITF